MNHQQGVCPFCGNKIEKYNDVEVYETLHIYPYECTTCGFEGREEYKHVFSRHTDVDGADAERT